ncbi:Beta-lactamase superfamily domain-containing protein [Desulfobacula phenolica]|uniref:Beta-lactamase superfamily domain-containing protein n=2 Tax=Desulfobacula phenolica TaxID=90732 RepID=A0A1H2K938_9BACT|nr:Beta-lactamase superfamily domain-containing protein [Desulfobacula phenolica]
MKETEANEIDNNIQTLLQKKKKLIETERKKQELEKKETEFMALVESTSTIRKELEKHSKNFQKSSDREGQNHICRMLFCGFLERDFTEQFHIHAPINFSGGFYIQTRHCNILFDPDDGTINGLKDVGVQIQDIDIIICSHYHPQARFDLHNILNWFSRNKGANTEGKQPKKLYLFSSEAVIRGRNNHPSLLVPADLDILSKEPFIATPGKSWIVNYEKVKKSVEVNESTVDATVGDDNLIIRTFPAYHNEAAANVNEKDEEGLEGNALSCFFLETKQFGILYTGDTEYPYERWGDKIHKKLDKKVTVLIANMKSIKPWTVQEKKRKQNSGNWKKLSPMSNQLGFEGTKQLALKLKPHTLVIRALGLECVAEKKEKKKTITYAPHKLGIIRSAMTALLEGDNDSKKGYNPNVVIPGRHELTIEATSKIEIKSNELVPAFPPIGVRRYGVTSNLGSKYVFITGNHKFANIIDYYIYLMKNDSRPYLVIQGESGGGKTQLARAIGAELSDTINAYDLATVNKDSQLFTSELFGHTKGGYTGAETDSSGLLSIENSTLILNQLEKLPYSQTITMLDLIDDWDYMPIKAPKSLPVRAKIIFTTNEMIDDLKNLSPDMKNRLKDRCLTITKLYDMTNKERYEVIYHFITEWCSKNNVILNKEAWDLLFEADLRFGAFRCLNGLLHKAASLHKMEYGLLEKTRHKKNNPIVVYIEKSFIERAMNENGVGRIDEGVNCKHTDLSELTIDLVLISAWFIINHCTMGTTRAHLKPGGNHGKNMAHKTFTNKLKEFKNCFSSINIAWDYFDDINDHFKGLQLNESSYDDVFNDKWKKEKMKGLRENEWKNKISTGLSEARKFPQVKKKFLTVLKNL